MNQQMTDEEKKAIERCKQLIKVEHANWIGLSNQDAIEKVLNLIEKQQRIIEEQKSRCSHLGRDAQKAVDYTFELNKEIEKKDKIMDLMAKYIARFDIEEDICRDKDCDEYTNIYTGEIDRKTCIKEYFKKKVEDK